MNSSVHASNNDDEQHERSKRFIFLQTSGIGVSDHERLHLIQFE